MSVQYKTIFEVKLFHEYFMTGDDGISVFDKPLQTERLNFADDIYRQSRASVTDIVDFNFATIFQDLYRGLQLKICTTNSGFRVAVKVKPRILADNSRVWEPVIPIPDGLNVFILINKKGSGMDEYSNARIRRAIPGTYFFSNSGGTNERIWPYLSGVIPSYDFMDAYEQGQIASFGTNDIRQFFRKNGNDVWQAVKGNAFASEADRILLPPVFDYAFIDTPGIKNADFALMDQYGNLIRSIHSGDPIGLEKVHLDFSADVASRLLQNSGSVKDKILFLEVSGTNGFNRVHPVLFGDRFFGEAWGVIHMEPMPTQPGFGFLEAENYLPSSFPVFEIPVKSRFNYWRYKNDRDLELQATPAHAGYLYKEGKYLITGRPQPVYQSFSRLPSDSGTGSIYIPAPSNLNVSINNERQMFFDITVQRSELFPVV